MMLRDSMYWLKPLVLILGLAVAAHATCAVSCVHSHSGMVPPSETASQPSQDCHRSETPDKSDRHKSGTSTCSHSQISGDRPTITAKDFKPLPVALPADIVTFSAEVGSVTGIYEFYSLKSYASAPPITVLRI